MGWVIAMVIVIISVIANVVLIVKNKKLTEENELVYQTLKRILSTYVIREKTP